MKKNIALLIPHLRDGGTERVVSNLTLYLYKKYNLYLILWLLPKKYPYFTNNTDNIN